MARIPEIARRRARRPLGLQPQVPEEDIERPAPEGDVEREEPPPEGDVEREEPRK